MEDLLNPSLRACELRGENGETLLHEAADYGRLDMINPLIDHGIDVNSEDENGWTPLMIAAERGHFDVVQLLIERGARVDAGEEVYFGGALHRAAYGGPMLFGRVFNDDSVLEFLLNNYPTLINAQDRLGNTPLHYAARYGRIAAVRLLLARGANALLLNNDGETPLLYAQANPVADVDIGAIAEVMWLLKEAFLNGQARALCEAAGNGDVNRVKALLLEGAIPAWENDMGFIALHYAAAGGASDVAEVLIDEAPRSIHACDNRNNTPLHLAAMAGRVQMVRLLLARGAQRDLLNDDGRTALQLAQNGGYLEVVAVFNEAITEDVMMGEEVTFQDENMLRDNENRTKLMIMEPVVDLGALPLGIPGSYYCPMRNQMIPYQGSGFNF